MQDEFSIMLKSPITLSAHELRHSLTDEIKEECKKYERNNIHIVLDNVVDTYNIGSAFRIADSIFAKKVWICGKDVATPLDRQVQKSSVNTCDLIEWEVLENTIDIFTKFDRTFDTIGGTTRMTYSHAYFIALEKATDIEDKISLEKCHDIYYNFCIPRNVPLVFIIGNESRGIDKEILFKASSILEIPMFGINNSMNVMNALAIACYSLI